MPTPSSSSPPTAPQLGVWYVYGIVPADVSSLTMPNGVDGADVIVEPVDGVAALVSVLDATKYDEASMDANGGDLEWLGPRAVAHDRVLTGASDSANGAVVPLPMFSLFSGRDAVRTMLAERAADVELALRAVASGREYALRVYRVDAELAKAMTALSPRLTEMARSAATASAGQRYLLERKLAAEKKREFRAVSQRIVDEIVSELAPLALRHVRSPIPRASDSSSDAPGAMVLNAAFLVAFDSIEPFQRMLTSVVERQDANGFRFDFTGPWPPYHFVDGAARDE